MTGSHHIPALYWISAVASHISRFGVPFQFCDADFERKSAIRFT